jgi:transcriptional regulator with XRE-family HTH domain
MANVAHPINLNLSDELKDRDFRRRFFWAEASARIAAQLVALRKRRDLNQHQVAEMTGTKQPAISRAEKADYQNWSFNTLRNIADALDARIRVFIEPSEDVLAEYETPQKETAPAVEAADLAAGACVTLIPMSGVNVSPQEGFFDYLFSAASIQTAGLQLQNFEFGLLGNVGHPSAAKDVENAKLKERVRQPQSAVLGQAAPPVQQQLGRPALSEFYSAGQQQPQLRAV